MNRVVLAIDSLTESHVESISRAAHGWAQCVRIEQGLSCSDYVAAIADATVVVGWPPPMALVESHVQTAQLASVGYDPYWIEPLLSKPGFVLCNAAGVMDVPVAEHCLAMMFALVRRLPRHLDDQGQHCWQRCDRYEELLGARLCMIGLGGIGRTIANAATALGMKVTGVTRDPSAHASLEIERVASFGDLASILPESNHVVACVPSTPATRNLFDAAMFGRVRPGTCFYNLGRGDLVDEAALLDALQSGHLAGAGLDAFIEEPLPETSPLWDLPNVIITPHVAGRSTKEFDRMTELIVENLSRLARGERPINCVIDNQLKCV